MKVAARTLVLFAGLLVIAAFAPASMVNVEDAQCLAGGVRKACALALISQSACEANGCCWAPTAYDPTGTACPNGSGVPACFLPNPPVKGYRVIKRIDKDSGLEAYLQLVDGGYFYGKDLPLLHLNVDFPTETQLRVTITDATEKRWEVPDIIETTPSSPVVSSSADYDFVLTHYPFAFAVVRKSTGETLFNTSSPKGSGNEEFNGLVFEDQYLEISTQLPQDSFVYGLGERAHPLRLNTSSAYYTFFAADNGGVPFLMNLYGSHPFYLEMRQKSKLAHGVFLLNSNGMDVYLGPSSLTYRAIGGVLDFFFMLGPSPADVIDQYTELIGRPHMPPYWALGWHQCRYGYQNLSVVETVVAEYAKHKIPLDTMWNDIDYMNKYLDFTFDPVRYPVKDVQNFVNRLHDNGQQYIVIVDAGIANVTSYPAYDQGLELDIFITRNATGTPLIGKVWPGFTAWTDYYHPNADRYWETQLKGFLNTVPVDGIWVDMNEPSNFCDGECATPPMEPLGSLNTPPYAINNKGCTAPLNKNTISMDANQHLSTHYNMHNLYGWSESRSTYRALRKLRQDKRPVIISRSTYPGHGRHAGHWLGDNASTWTDLYMSIPGILNFQMFGIPLVGADICGFEQNTTPELCARWMELGAFYPFSRNHNALGSISQEPYTWPEVAEISRNILAVRYSLLPYYYTLFYEAHKTGATVARPLFFEFREDVTTWDIDRQFLIGSGLLISPVLEANTSTVRAYFPAGKWYDFFTLAAIEGANTPTWLDLHTPLDKINVHIRGGLVLPLQAPALTTAETRKNNFHLVAALSAEGAAVGSLYQDSGDGYAFEERQQFTKTLYHVFNGPSGGYFQANILENNYAGAAELMVETISVAGLSRRPTSVVLEGHTLPLGFDPYSGLLTVHGLQLSMAQSWRLTWTY